MFLTDLLPSFFDSVVLRMTRRKLLPVEREAVLSALVNCVGESVMRRVRATSDTNYIETITTDDHFSDEWTSRAEIINAIAKSSGLSEELSEFALFLLETRLDLSATHDKIAIHEIGAFKPLAQSGLDFEFVYRLWTAYFDDFVVRPGELASTAVARLRSLSPPPDRPLVRAARVLFGLPEYGARRFLEVSKIATSFRRRSPYQIILSDGVAYSQRYPSFNVVEIRSTPENTLRAKS
jgi:hypothetical protein